MSEAETTTETTADRRPPTAEPGEPGGGSDVEVAPTEVEAEVVEGETTADRRPPTAEALKGQASTPKRVVGPAVAPGGAAEVVWRTAKEGLFPPEDYVTLVDVQGMLAVEGVRVGDGETTTAAGAVGKRVHRGVDVVVSLRNRTGALRPAEVVFWVSGAVLATTPMKRATNQQASGSHAHPAHQRTQPQAGAGFPQAAPRPPSGSTHSGSAVGGRRPVASGSPRPSVVSTAPAPRQGPPNDVLVRMTPSQAERILRIVRAPMLHGVAPHDLPDLARVLENAINEARASR